MKSHKNKTIDPVKEKKNAICAALGVQEDDVFEETSGSHYGLDTFGVARKQYAIGTREEAEEACQSYIRDSIWAFNADFILGCCNLPHGLKRAIEIFQREECENANEPLFELVDKTCGIIKFTEEAISADGLGHFLATYDGQEIEAGKFIIFRI